MYHSRKHHRRNVRSIARTPPDLKESYLRGVSEHLANESKAELLLSSQNAFKLTDV